MASPSHRKVILTRPFRAAGIGAVLWQDGDGDVENPVCFYTLDFGRALPPATPAGPGARARPGRKRRAWKSIRAPPRAMRTWARTSRRRSG